MRHVFSVPKQVYSSTSVNSKRVVVPLTSLAVTTIGLPVVPRALMVTWNLGEAQKQLRALKLDW